MDIKTQREDSGTRVGIKASDHPNNLDDGRADDFSSPEKQKAPGHGKQHHLRLLGLPLGRTHMNYPIEWRFLFFNTRDSENIFQESTQSIFIMKMK